MTLKETTGSRKIHSAAAFLLLCASTSLTADAAAAAEELRGVRAFTINVESLDEHAIKCAISKQAVEKTARSILQPPKGLLGPPAGSKQNTFLYYNVNVIALTSGDCIYSFSLDAQVIGELRVGGQANLGAYTVWHKGGIRSTFKGNAASALRYDIEAVTQSFVAAWSEVNP